MKNFKASLLLTASVAALAACSLEPVAKDEFTVVPPNETAGEAEQPQE